MEGITKVFAFDYSGKFSRHHITKVLISASMKNLRVGFLKGVWNVLLMKIYNGTYSVGTLGKICKVSSVSKNFVFRQSEVCQL